MSPNTTLICSFYSFQPVVASIHAFSPSKIVAVIAEGSLKKDPHVKEEFEQLVSVFGKVTQITKEEVDGTDILAIARKAIELLEADDSEKIVNISGGWKLLAQGLLYGCYARPHLVSKIVCNNIDKSEEELVDLPKFSFELSEGKKAVLEAIASLSSKGEGKLDVQDIAKKAEKSDVMAYQHIDFLKRMNYVDNNNRITVAGKLALLWRDEGKK
ncbi:MAG: CRISPR-associated CARF protein Csa3 [Candidatus Micrarchaeota archaeon]|nr:CRISPR-associated CARF protein Csa3 [Candidatus Micrarchaeota archaeon]